MKHISNKNISRYDEVEYDMERRILTIYYANYTKENRKRLELLHFLMGYKIMYAPELGTNKLVYMDRVFQFSELHEEILGHTGKVTLKYMGKLIDHASSEKNRSFIHRYYKLKYLN